MTLTLEVCLTYKQRCFWSPGKDAALRMQWNKDKSQDEGKFNLENSEMYTF